MRIPIIPMLTFAIVCLLLDVRIYCVAKHRWGRKNAVSYAIVSVILWCILALALCLPRRGEDDTTLLAIMWLMFGIFSVYTSKLIFVAVDFIGCIPRLFEHKRLRGFFSAAALMSAIIMFVAMWWGALINRYRICVKEVEVEVPELPTAFDGYRIVHFSDIHTGTYGSDTTFINKLVDKINSLDGDAIMFTGDIVNRRTDEMYPHVATLSRLHAHDGVFSILGNHDYGDYADWETPDAKAANRDSMLSKHAEMGWTLLLDEHRYIKRGNDSIAIAGVENIGDAPFPSYGNLEKALRGIKKGTTTLLLSHNPAHWNDIYTTNEDDMPITLTLSGHTHAMQIEAFGISPAALRYPRWGGLYTDKSGNRHLYVNIGVGTVGLPMRLGATPEVTVIKLKSIK